MRLSVTVSLVALLLAAGCVSPSSVQEVRYRGWEAVRLDNGVARAVLVPDIARIMAFERPGGPNLIWQDEALQGKPADLRGGDWQNFGGAKLWVAPQSAWGWPPDPVMDQGACDVMVARDGVVTLRGMSSPATGVRLSRTVSLRAESSVLELVYTMENTATSNVTWGIWNVIQVKPGGRALIPNREDARTWEDSRWRVWDHWRREGDVFVLHHAGQEGKVMSISPEGWLAYERGGDVLVVDLFTDTAGTYPAGHGSGEVYSGGSYIELEHVGPQVELAPGESTQMRETWMFFSLEDENVTDSELAARIRRRLRNPKVRGHNNPSPG